MEFASEVDLNENESNIITFFVQTRALLWKNYLIFTRKYRIMVFMLITPICVAHMLNSIIEIAELLHNSGVVDFGEEEIGKVLRCRNGQDYLNNP